MPNDDKPLKQTSSTLPMLCVESISATADLLHKVLGWTSAHGGEEFDELVDANNKRVLWLHTLQAPEHARFADNNRGGLGRGLTLYVFVDDIDATLALANTVDVLIVEELAMNPNAGFREFTFKESNGYHLTVAEHPNW